MTSTTHVNVDVTGLSIGTEKPKLTVKHLHLSLTSKSPTGSGEPPIVPGTDTVIEGAAIDGHLLTIELALPIFQQHNTMSKLLVASDNPQFVNDSGDLLYMTPARRHAEALGTVPPSPPRRVQCASARCATIVKSIKWAGDPVGVTFDQNCVIVPQFGKSSSASS